MIRTHPANVFVCECITQSLFRLLKRKAYSEITVTGLVHEAGVSRNSFYRNYQNIEDIIQQFLEEKTSKWWDNFIIEPERYPHVIAEMFQHFLDMKEVVLVYNSGQEKLNNLYYQMKEQRRCSTWRKTKNPTLRNLNSRLWICIMPEEPRIHNWNVNMA